MDEYVTPLDLFYYINMNYTYSKYDLDFLLGLINKSKNSTYIHEVILNLDIDLFKKISEEQDIGFLNILLQTAIRVDKTDKFKIVSDIIYKK